jgi:Cytochrome P460
MKKSILTLVAIATIFIIIQSCKKDKDEDTTIQADTDLYNEIKNVSGYTYYEGGDTLSPLGGSPHGIFKLRFNTTAHAALDSTGKLPVGGTFPTGSVIVKEKIVGSNATLFAVMKKDPSNTNAGSGWLWAEYNTDGSTQSSVTLKGGTNGCVSCHSFSPNRDLTKTFDLH